MSASDRILILNLAVPSRLVSIATDGSDIATLVPDLGVAPDGIAIDAKARHIFWTYMGSVREGEDFNENDGRIERIDFDGGNRMIVIPTGGTFTPKQMQCDPERGLIYWSDREGMRVMRARTDGSAITVLVQTGEGAEDCKDRTRHCVGLAIDPAAGHVYWTQKGPPDGNQGRIFRAPIDLPEGTDPAARPDIELLFDALPEPIDLEWDPNTSQLYWTDRGAPAQGGNTLNRATIAGDGPYEHEILLSGLKEGIGLALDHRGRRVFTSDLGGFVRVMSLDDPGHAKEIYSGHGPLTGIALFAA